MVEDLELFATLDPAVPTSTGSEQQVAEQVDLLRQAIALGDEAYGLVDPSTGAFLDCTTRAHERLGYSREEYLALGALGIQARGDHNSAWLQDLLARMQRQFQQHQRGVFETQHRCRDGEVRDVEVHYQQVHYRGRDLILTLQRDVTRLRHSLSKAEQLNTLLKEAEKLTQLGSWELIHATGDLQWSEGTFLIFETTPERLQPTYSAFLERIHPQDRELVDRTFQQSLERREPYQISHRLLFPDGRIKVVEERGTTSFNAAGEPLRSIGTVQDITQVYRYEQELERVAYVDRLTQLPNRQGAIRYLRERIEVDLSNQLSGCGLAVLNLDLDQFQALNDTFGPEVGDQLLVHAARVLRSGLPGEVFVARLESDEFLVVQPCKTTPDLQAMAEAIQRLLAQARPPVGELPLLPSATIGAAHWPGQGRDPHALLQSANTALVEAKRQGKGRLCLYSSVISERIRERVQLELDLERAIDRDQFTLMFQPQVDAQGEAVGAEVLLRWRHHSGQWISPDVFIPLAEQSGQIRLIGEWVLEQTCRQWQRWQSAGWRPPRLAVNLSAAQLGVARPGLAQRLIGIVESYGLPADAIEFEITETALIENPVQSRSDTEELVHAGFRLAIDDFGTGYASLVSLHTLPVHKIKIDTSFVRQISTSTTVLSIVKSTILMARELQLDVLAEGVEARDQWALLRQLGCDQFQGYLFGRPMPADLFRQQIEVVPAD